MARAAISWAVALLLLHCTCGMGAVLGAGNTNGQEGERLIGWRGETYSQNQGEAAEAPNATKSSNSSPWIETISWVPRAFIYHGFLSHEECEHLMATAKKRLSRSMVVSDKGESTDPIRTSYSASFSLREDDVVTAVEDRIAGWTHLPVCHQEPMEVLRYQNGQKYDSHWDWFDSHETTPALGNRMATVLMYLSDVGPSSGGETALPLAVPLDEDAQSVKGKGYSDCANRQGLSIVPRQGDVLLFWDMDPAGKTPDRHALHASCPTFKGEKWTATKWIHNKCIS